MNKQDRREFLTVVSNEAIAERIIGMSLGEKREAYDEWQWRVKRHTNGTHPWMPDFRTWLFDRVEQKILEERDASYYEAGEPL